LPELESAAQFATTDTILIRRKIINDIKCFKKREFTVVKKGACLWGLKPTTFGALPVKFINSFAIVSMATLFTNISIIPLHVRQIFIT
jgi:hypothetical protein